VAPGYEEWRLAIELPEGSVKPGEILERLRTLLPSDVDAYRKGRRGIRCYAPSRDSMADA
jgi:hypothetical protein